MCSIFVEIHCHKHVTIVDKHDPVTYAESLGDISHGKRHVDQFCI